MTTSTRREFLGTTAAAATLAGAALLGAAEKRTLNLGLIGAGGYGMADAKAALKAGGTRIAAVCDVDSDHLAQSADELDKLQAARPKTFKLYQDLLDLKGLDAVIIATPPHWHALPFIAALERRLDIYCEKPLAYDIREGRAMVEAARRHGRIVQIGFQRRQSKAFHEVKQFIDVRRCRQDRAGRRPDSLHGRHQGPHAAGPARRARLGPLVRPRPQDPLQPASRTRQLAIGKDQRPRAPCRLGYSPDRRLPHILGLTDAEASHGGRRVVLSARTRSPRPTRSPSTSNSTASRSSGGTASGARRNTTRDQQRHLLLRRAGHGVCRRRPLGGPAAARRRTARSRRSKAEADLGLLHMQDFLTRSARAGRRSA